MLETITGAGLFAAGAWFGSLMLAGRLLPRRSITPKSYIPQRPVIGEKPEDERKSIDKMFVNPEFNYDEYVRTGGRSSVPRVKNVDTTGRETGSKAFQT